MKIPFEQNTITIILFTLFSTALMGYILSRSTTKDLSKNFTLANFEMEGLQVLVSIIKDDCSTRTADPDYIEYIVPTKYEMDQVRLYSNGCFDPW